MKDNSINNRNNSINIIINTNTNTNQMEFMFYDPLTDLFRVQRQLAQIQRELCHEQCSSEAAQVGRRMLKEEGYCEDKDKKKEEEEKAASTSTSTTTADSEEDVDKALTEKKEKTADKDLWWPAVDIKETEGGYELHAELPGVKKEDVHIELRGQGANKRLVVSGTKAAEEKKEGEKWHRVERSFGNFERAFTVPADTAPEDIKATFENGMLRVAFPKPKPTEPVKIEIN